jgi:flagellar protein FliS
VYNVKIVNKKKGGRHMQYAQRNKYLETGIQTASPAQLLIMLYDGAIRNARSAIDAIERKDFKEAHRSLVMAQDIVSEFIITLDRNSDVADGLLRLYDYFLFRLIEANTKKVVEPVQEVLGYLVELRETWGEAAKAMNVQATAGSGIRHA